MPLALSKKQTFTITMESDRGEPPEKRPRFIYRYLSDFEIMEIEQRQERLSDCVKPRDAYDLTYKSAATGLIGWENMSNGKPIKFSIKNLRKVIGPVEAQELIMKIIMQGMTEIDKKKLELPSASSMGQSARTAPVSKSAKTNRRK